MVQFGTYMKSHRRYVAFGIMLFGVLMEQSTKVAISLAMIGGMVKKNCSDPDDTGKFCISEKTKALLIGAYFYGFTLQMIPTAIARRTSSAISLRFAFFAAGVIQLTFPRVMEYSIILAISLQMLRGFLAGVIVPTNMDFARKWTFGKETRAFITALGNIFFIGTGFGPMLAGFLATRLGWESFFYVSGGSCVFIFILLCLLIPENPLNSLLIKGKERDLFVRRIEAHKGAASNNAKGGTKTTRKTPLREILTRVYPYAFCIFMMGNTFQFYTLMAVTPFYLDGVLGASTDLVAVVQVILGVTAAVTTNLYSLIFTRIDKILPWLKCRALMTFIPYTVRCIFIAIIPAFSSPIMVIICSAVAISTSGAVFSGSLITVNYELDPVNAGFILSMFNSIGQTSGFTAPFLKSKVVSTSLNMDNDNRGISNLKLEWATFYYIVASATPITFTAIILGYAIRKSEWKKHESLKIDENKKSLKISIADREAGYSNLPNSDPAK